MLFTLQSVYTKQFLHYGLVNRVITVRIPAG